MTRAPIPQAKPGQQIVRWGKADRHAQPDLAYAWGGDGADKSDSRMLSTFFEDTKNHAGRTLREELERRGYDLTTLRFSIARKPKPDDADAG